VLESRYEALFWDGYLSYFPMHGLVQELKDILRIYLSDFSL